MFGTFGAQEFVLVLLLIALGVLALPLAVALATSGHRYPDSFIDRAYPDGHFVTATPARRFAGELLDNLIIVLTLYIGWLVWLAIVAPKGQSPGKSLVGTYVMRSDGRIADPGQVWLRDFVVKRIGLTVVSLIPFAGLVGLAAPLWCLWDRDKQCLWDKVTSTYVAFAPSDPVSSWGYAEESPVTEPMRYQGDLPTQVEAPRTFVVATRSSDVTIHEAARSSQMRAEVDSEHTRIIRQAPPSFAYLAVRSGPRAGEIFELSDEVTIGRSGTSTIALSDAAISQQHARIRLRDGGWTFVDLDSLNGSFLVGDAERVRLTAPHRLLDGDRVEVGPFVLQFLQIAGPTRAV